MAGLRNTIRPLRPEIERSRQIKEADQCEIVINDVAVPQDSALGRAIGQVIDQFAQGRGINLSSVPMQVPVLFAGHLLGMRRQQIDELIAQGQLVVENTTSVPTISLIQLIELDAERHRKQSQAISELGRLSF